jgi:acyl-CoA reductase-like NAD-dependent aldehyde dehydrogenase
MFHKCAASKVTETSAVPVSMQHLMGKLLQAAAPITQADLLIDGELVKSSTSSWIDVRDPATQEVVNRLPEATAEEFDRAVSSAKAAFPAWANTPVPARQRVMFSFLEQIKQHKQFLAESITREQGKTVSDAHGDVFRGMEVRFCSQLQAHV